MKCSPKATQFPLWGAFGVPEGGSGGEGAVFDQFDIAFALMSVVFWAGQGLFLRAVPFSRPYEGLIRRV